MQFTYSSGLTQLRDYNGHAANWTIDGDNRVVATKTFTVTNPSPTSALLTSETWSADNQVTSVTDARLLETDFAYDNVGNLIAQALPSQTNYTSLYTGTQTKPAPSAKTFRPTTRYSYEAHTVLSAVNNDSNTAVVAYNVSAVCDPVQSDNNSGDWTATPPRTDSLCTGSNYASFAYAHTAAEPNGELSTVRSPKGETSTMIYPSTSSLDYGLPTSVTGPSITSGGQTFSQTIVASYNADGTVAQYSADDGAHYSAVTYNGLGEPVKTTDPTGVSSYACYNLDGSLSATTSPAQYAIDGKGCGANSTAYAHDPDGNVTEVTRHWHGATAFHRWYDGLDRIVEASADGIGNADHWMGLHRRYLYDLSQQGGAATLGYAGWGYSFAAYGSLYKTQQCWVNAYSSGGSNSCAWTDMTAMAYDPLGRLTHRYARKPGSYGPQFTPDSYTPGAVEHWNYAHDGSTPGLLNSETKPDGTTVSVGYTPDGQVSSQTVADSATASEDSTSNLTFEFDPDGRTVSASTSYFGADTYSFDYDGLLGQYAESTAYNPDAEILTYGYYANGWRQSLKIASPSYAATRTYAYDNAGRRTGLTTSDYGPFAWTYNAAGRMLTQSDPATGSAINCAKACNTTNYPNGFTFGKKTVSYNSAGQPSTLTLPDGATFKSPPNTTAGITWDAENEPTAFAVGKPSGFAGAGSPSPYVTGVHFVYDARGELNTMSGTSAALSNTTYENTENFAYFDGHPCMDTSCEAANTTSYFPMLDPYTGASFDQGDNTANPASPKCHTIDTLAYDSMGRNSSSSQVASPAGCVPTYTNFTRTYDAFDRTRSETDYSSGTTWNTYHYAWGPTGNVRQFKSNGSTYTLHWDGSDLLFVTDGAGHLVQVNIEKLAATGWNPSSTSMTVLQIYDRDLSGYAAATHTGKYDSGVSVMGNHYAPATICGNRWLCNSSPTPNLIGAFPADGSAPTAPIITLARTDGYQAGSLTFQGVRTYDSQAGQWTTADHFLGQLTDPMSQFSYAWNGGNPVVNGDPSGYAWWGSVLGGIAGSAAGSRTGLVVLLVVAAVATVASDGLAAPLAAEVAVDLFEVDAVAGVEGSEVWSGIQGLDATVSGPEVMIPARWLPYAVAGKIGGGIIGGGAGAWIGDKMTDPAQESLNFGGSIIASGGYFYNGMLASYSCSGNGCLSWQQQLYWDHGYLSDYNPSNSVDQINSSIYGYDPIAWAYGNADPTAGNCPFNQCPYQK